MPRVAEAAGDEQEPELEVDLFSLLAAFRGVLERAKSRPRVVLPPEQMSIEQRIEQLLERLSETEAVGFEELFADANTRGALIVTFLALLEMIRLKLIRAFQSGSFGPIRVYKRPRPADAPHPIRDPEQVFAEHHPARTSRRTRDETNDEGRREDEGRRNERHARPKNPDANAVSVDTLIAAAPAADAADEAETTGLVGIVEALIFASPEPITPKQLFKVLDSEPKEEVLAAVEELKRRYARSGGLQLVEVAAGYQIVTRPELHEWVRRLFHERTSQKLSVAALETLAVIAYKQPVTAIEIAEIRGVNTAGVIGTLLERSLVKISGRKQVVGRPFLYSTTREFLDRFGLRDLTDLPKVEDMADALGFEPPAGLAQQADLAEEQATPEDQQILFGEGEEESEGARVGRGRLAGQQGEQGPWSSWSVALGPHVAPTAFRSARTSSAVRSRDWPGFSPASVIGPIRVRVSCSTG